MLNGNEYVPPYNRFDKIPTHALHCGTIQEQTTDSPPFPERMRTQNIISDILKGHADAFLHNGIEQRVGGRLDSTGSRHSMASTRSSSASHDSTASSIKCNSTHNKQLTDIDKQLGRQLQNDLYIGEQSPPPYHGVHNVIETPPRRQALPKKSEAAQQVVELLKESQKSNRSYGTCFSCKAEIATVADACQAMGNIYHNKCFTCHSCGRMLREKAFYCIHGRIYCEEDYMYSGFQQTIEKCAECGHLIMDQDQEMTEILQAMGKSFHPGCFRCTVCNECLDGVPFTIDVKNKVYCVNDYHRLYAPKCAACGLAIIPMNGSDETVRVVALDKDFHIDCYHCEKCKMQLTDEPDKRCYPMGDHLFCYSCHIEVRSVGLPSPSGSIASSTSSLSSSYSRTPNSAYGSMPWQQAAPAVNGMLTAARGITPQCSSPLSAQYTPIPIKHEQDRPAHWPNYSQQQATYMENRMASEGSLSPIQDSSASVCSTTSSPGAAEPDILASSVLTHSSNMQPMLPKAALPNRRKPKLPLSDIIMHKNILASLTRSTTGSAASNKTQHSPLSPRLGRRLNGEPSSLRQVSIEHPAPIGAYTSLRHYNTSWQAHNARQLPSNGSINLGTNNNTEPHIVTTKEFPPKLPARGEDTPPERPPKLVALHIAHL